MACTVNRQLLPLKGFYFLFHAAIASLHPYLVVYLKQQGLSASESGVLFGSMPFLSFLVQPLVGAAADRWLKHKAVLVTATVLTGLSHLLFLAVPPRTPAGNVLTSDARLTCFSHHVPRLSVCCNDSGISVCTSRFERDWSFIANGTGNDTLTGKNSSAFQEGATREGQTQCWRSVTEVLHGVSQGAAKFTPYECQVRCGLTEENNEQTDRGELNSNHSFAATTEFNFLKPFQLQNMSLASTQDRVVNNESSLCADFHIESFLYNDTLYQGVKCFHQNDLNCRISCEVDPELLCQPQWRPFDLTFGLVFVVFLISFVTYSPVISLVDAASHSMLKEQRHKFGQQRLWGTLGFSLTAIVTSVCVYVIKEQGQNLDYATMFYSHAAFCLASAVVAKFIAVSSDIRCGNVLKGACQLLTIPRVSVFVFVVFVFGVFYGSVTFVLWFIVELGAPPQLFGLCVVSSVILEVPTFFFSGRLIRRLGPVPCLCVSIATMSTRLLAYSLLGNPWLVLLIEPLHGVTFGLMLSSATTYASIVSPPGMSATTQGLVGGILFGSGRGAGGLLTGWMFSAVGARITYAVYSGTGALVVVSYLLLHRFVFTEPTTLSRAKDVPVSKGDPPDAEHPLMPATHNGTSPGKHGSK